MAAFSEPNRISIKAVLFHVHQIGEFLIFRPIESRNHMAAV